MADRTGSAAVTPSLHASNMRIDAGQHLRMDQRMKLAPRMIQSMEILQMPQQALEERIEQELAANPTLEVREPGTEREQVQAELAQDDRDNREGERELVVGDPASNGQESAADDFERLANLVQEYGDAWASSSFETGDYTDRGLRSDLSGDGERDRKIDALANTSARSTSLYDQLMEQWRLVEIPGPDAAAIARAGKFLIGFVDADGYIRTQRDALVSQLPPDISPEHLDAAWTLLQKTLEPPGLAARDLRECLLLQIDARQGGNWRGGISSEAASSNGHAADLSLPRELVTNHLKDIEANRLPKIARELGRSVEEIKQAILKLRQFQPHPGRQLADQMPHAIHPDAIIEYDEETDSYKATLTRGRTPALNISRAYQKMIRDAAVEKRTREFVSQNLRSARWLLDAIQQRESTLLRVINVVLQAQREYFDQGPQALKPLPMTLVADQLGIHVATVSRAVNEKYLQTPRGIVPLRMFFSGGTETESGDAMSWAAVQAKLQEVIDAEDKTQPFSDDQLVEELKKKGIEIARRTVAKYRKQLNIPTARQRREY